MVAPPLPPAPQQPRRASGLAITALVLSLVVFIPLLPLVGAILGLVALKRHRSDRSGRGMAVAAIPVGLGLFLLLQVLPAIVAVSTFQRFQTMAKHAEADHSLHQLRYAATDAAYQESVDAAGNILPPTFPRGNTGWVPAIGCCAQATAPSCQRREADWQTQPWRALQFQPELEHRFQYRYSSDGQTVTIEARADLDCDGTYSLSRITGKIVEGESEFGMVEHQNQGE